ncbi:hypothetical protein KBB76_00085 [Candidatus Saccharibacteria bacterium]|nr:hypothetical protein [Candidatus Saccharibacteria bacterium]
MNPITSLMLIPLVSVLMLIPLAIPLVFYIYLRLIINFNKTYKKNWKVTENKQYEPQYQKYLNNIKTTWVLMVVSSIILFIVANYVASKDTSGGAPAGFMILFFGGLAITYVLGFLIIASNISVPLGKLKESLSLYPSNEQIYLNTLARFSLPIKLHLAISSIILFAGFIGPLAIPLISFGRDEIKVLIIEKR